MPQPILPDYANEFFNAVNNHDEGAFLDAFAPTGIVDDWGRTYAGREAIKSWSAKELIGADGVFTPQRSRRKKNGITVTGVYRSRHINGLNSFTLQQQDGKLTKVKIRKGRKTPSIRFATHDFEMNRVTHTRQSFAHKSPQNRIPYAPGGRRVNSALAFTLPAIAFASMFGFRFVDNVDTSSARLMLTAVSTAAGVVAVAGVLQTRLAAPLVGRSATHTLIVVDVMMVAGAAFGASDALRSHAPYITGWIIDLAAIGWVGAIASTIRFLRHRSADDQPK